MKQIVTVLFTMVAIVLLVVLFIYSGMYNVAATSQHTALGNWILNTAKERSIRTHAYSNDEISASPDLSGGQDSYTALCVMCHGSPTSSPWEPTTGLLPVPPDLREEGEEWSLGELVWTIEQGIKMTGMPAFGPSHDKSEIIAVATFVDSMATFSIEKSKRFIESLESTPEDTTSSGHTHDHG